MTRLPARALGVVLTSGALLLAAAAPALAHPLGNFSVNTHSAVAVEPTAVRVDVVVDRAEIPTRQLLPDLELATGALPGGTAGPAADLCADVVRAASLRVDGRAVPLQLEGSALSLPEGAAGLRTSRLVCALRSADLGELVGSSVEYALADVSPAPGWRETTAVGDGVRVDADVPARSRSAALTAYPEDELAAPLDVPGTVLDVARGTGVVTGTGSVLDAPAPDDGLLRGADRLTTAFTGLVAQQSLTVPFAALAVLVAVALGALHAFAPGHGKTVIAAYLVGRRGTLRDAALLGLSVTVTHTLGVVLLGVVLTVVGLAAPSEVYPVLGTASGLLLVGVGAVLLRAARRTRAAARSRAVSPVPEPVLVGAGAPVEHRHDHDHDHDHDHHDHDHDHDHHDHDHPQEHHAHDVVHSHGGRPHSHALPPQGAGWRSVLVVGLAGGLVPSPSALLVLLGGIALGRAWFGLGLVVAYGAGMALSLAATALVLVRARGRVDRLAARAADDPRLRRAARAAAALPLVAAVLVVVGGLVVTVRSVLLL